MVTWAHCEGTPRGEGHREVLRDPDTIDGFSALAGAVHEGGQEGKVGMGRHDSLPERVGSTEVGNLWLANVAIGICHKDNGVTSCLPGEESHR